MEVIHPDETQSPTCPQRVAWFPQPAPITMTIATNGYQRVPTMRSSSMRANPMMRVTLPKDFSDDPLASPVGAMHPPAFFNAPAPIPPRAAAIPTHTPPPSMGFNVFTRRRESSIDKKPPMPPPLRRTTSAPMSASMLVSKMAPMLKRVVSGSKTQPTEGEADEDADGARESLLMLLQVPDMQRQSALPLMMAHMDY